MMTSSSSSAATATVSQSLLFYFESTGLIPGQSTRGLWWMRGHWDMFSQGTSFSTDRLFPWMLHTLISFTYYWCHIISATDNIIKQQVGTIHPYANTEVHSISQVYGHLTYRHGKANRSISTTFRFLQLQTIIENFFMSHQVTLSIKYSTYLLTYSIQQSPSWEANWFCS